MNVLIYLERMYIKMIDYIRLFLHTLHRNKLMRY